MSTSKRSRPLVASLLLAVATALAFEVAGCDPPQGKSDHAQAEGARAAAPRALEPTPAPAPPAAWIEGQWAGTTALVPTPLGGRFAPPPRVAPPPRAAPPPEVSPAAAPDPAGPGENSPLKGESKGESKSATMALSIGEGGDVSGKLSFLGQEAVLLGLAQLEEGPVRLRVEGEWLHGTVVLTRSAEQLSGQLRLSFEAGRDTSELVVYAGSLQLSREEKRR